MEQHTATDEGKTKNGQQQGPEPQGEGSTSACHACWCLQHEYETPNVHCPEHTPPPPRTVRQFLDALGYSSGDHDKDVRGALLALSADRLERPDMIVEPPRAHDRRRKDVKMLAERAIQTAYEFGFDAHVSNANNTERPSPHPMSDARNALMSAIDSLAGASVLAVDPSWSIPLHFNHLHRP